jgi:hypothetical protein
LGDCFLCEEIIMIRTAVLCLSVILTTTINTIRAAEPPPELNRALVRQAEPVIKLCQKRGYKNVGVLKFLATKDNKSFNDNVGPLNLLLARRLEIAMILQNDRLAPVGIAVDANTVAAGLKGASYLKKDERAHLFDAEYSAAWGGQKVKPDAFVTGAVSISPDLRTLSITLMMFDRENNTLEDLAKLKLIPAFQAAMLPSYLSEVGETFLLRGAFDPETTIPEKGVEQALTTAVAVKQQTEKHPVAQKAVPVTLTVKYDGQPVTLEMRDGEAFLPEPKDGQKVTMELSRDGSKERYGVVLKVNGENTLRRQRLPDLECRKWVLDPGDPTLTLKGYQVDQKTIQEFRVASAVESKEREMSYGPHVGTISMSVFRETKARQKLDLSTEGQFASLVSRGEVAKTKTPPDDYDALKTSLLEDANRGLIVEGEQVPGNVITVEFTPDPTPIMCLTLIYYRP